MLLFSEYTIVELLERVCVTTSLSRDSPGVYDCLFCVVDRACPAKTIRRLPNF
jgi:hypothetical protein